MKLFLSPFSVDAKNNNQNILLAGNWCITKETLNLFKKSKINYIVQNPRTLVKDEFICEAEYCLKVFEKYTDILSSELNRIHGTNHSLRYWNTLCNRILYPLIATIIDKYYNLRIISDKYELTSVDILDYNSKWFTPHGLPSFGGSRLLHFILYSIIADNFPNIKTNIIDNNYINKKLKAMGDGKKDIRSRSTNNLSSNKIISYFKYPINLFRTGSLPLTMLKYTKADVVCLGDQYLKSSQIKKLLRSVNNLPFYYYGDSKKINYPNLPEESLRNKIKFPIAKDIVEKSLQKAISLLFPTYLIENYNYMVNVTKQFIPEKKLIILNSQHCNGRELLDFFIAHSVEEFDSHHIQINHGGCYGIMGKSIQEEVWSKISDTYALWSNSKKNNSNNHTIKMPSLRFHDYQFFPKKNLAKKNILYLGSGYYPYRYSYDSIFPLTISNSYDDWQIRFFSHINKKFIESIVLRDFHGYTELSHSNLGSWLSKNKISKSYKSTSLYQELIKAKLTVHCVPQTTYMETITANIPTICYWNPDDNLIREDLIGYFDALVDVGIVHYNPESAAKKLNDISDYPFDWWNSNSVIKAKQYFCDNVCLTSKNAISQWSNYINSLK